MSMICNARVLQTEVWLRPHSPMDRQIVTQSPRNQDLWSTHLEEDTTCHSGCADSSSCAADCRLVGMGVCPIACFVDAGTLAEAPLGNADTAPRQTPWSQCREPHHPHHRGQRSLRGGCKRCPPAEGVPCACHSPPDGAPWHQQVAHLCPALPLLLCMGFGVIRSLTALANWSHIPSHRLTTTRPGIYGLQAFHPKHPASCGENSLQE